MNEKILKLCGWSGIAAIVLMAFGFGVVAGFIPPPAPSDTMAQTAQLFVEHKNGIRFGMILSMVASALLFPYAVSMSLLMRRIEGAPSALAFIQLGMGAAFDAGGVFLAAGVAMNHGVLSIFRWHVRTGENKRS